MKSDGDVVTRTTDFGDYEEDVMIEILARLPIKSLMRFRCVCKSWFALISDSSCFAKKHLSYYAERGNKLSFMMRPPLILDLEALNKKNLTDVDEAVTEVGFPILDSSNLDSGFRHVVGACNGLLCVNLHHKAILLWNPYTRDSKVFMLPKPFHEHTFAIYYIYGFGYDSASHDYKFIRWFPYDDPDGVSGHIFSLKTGSCRKVNDIVPKTYTRGLFVNGALHWLYSLPVPGGSSRILSFNLGEEKFQQTIPLPYDGMFYDPLIHQDCLCVCAFPNGTNTINIWMMKEYGVKESWTEVLRFSLENYVRQVDDRMCMTPVCILENGVVVIDKSCLCDRLMVLSNIKEKMHVAEVMENLSNLKEERILAEEPEFETVEDTETTEFETFIYRETLVSPNIRT